MIIFLFSNKKVENKKLIIDKLKMIFNYLKIKCIINKLVKINLILNNISKKEHNLWVQLNLCQILFKFNIILIIFLIVIVLHKINIMILKM